MKTKVILATFFSFIFIGFTNINSNSQSLNNMNQSIKHYPNFKSKNISSRNVDILLPDNYDKNTSYPVIYMHDGQNLFDPSTSYIGVDWGVDEAMEKLLQEDSIEPAIIVGIWNTPDRISEYMPFKAYDSLNENQKTNLSKLYKRKFNIQLDKVVSDNYLKFIVEELKPFVDSNYKTLSDKDNTFIMGSSMGGLISIYALSEYPEVFGGAGCVSTHWPAGDGIVIEYLRNNLPVAGNHKIYFDFGTETTDRDYEPYQVRMDKIMEDKGYIINKDWLTIKFPGAEHSERAWRQRVDIPLKFFLGK